MQIIQNMANVLPLVIMSLTVSGLQMDDLAHTLQDVAPYLLKEHLSSMVKQGLPPYVIEDPCSAYIKKYSSAAANFSSCFVENARPLTACLKCIEEYLQAVRVFQSLSEAPYKPGMTCKQHVLEVNQTQIILGVHDFILWTWEDLNCQNCYAYYTLNESISHPVMSNETIQFFNMTSFFGECLFNISVAEDVPIFITNMTSNASACRDCLKPYEDLNQFYSSMEKLHMRKICADLAASINNTHKLWNQVLKCGPVYSSIKGAIVLSSLLCTLPIIFYLANKIHGTKVERTLVKQKRLGTIRQASNASSGREDRIL